MNTDDKRTPQTDRDNPSARSDESTIRHETIPGEKPSTVNKEQSRNRSSDGKTSLSTMDEDLN